MKIKTRDLIGQSLDFFVAMLLGYDPECDDIGVWLEGAKSSPCYLTSFTPSTNWEQAGPIIEKLIEDGYKIEKMNFCVHGVKVFKARGDDFLYSWGDTLSIAAMRCFVAQTLGDEVEIPDAYYNALTGEVK